MEFTPLSRYVYYRPEEGPGPRCGREQALAQDAFYCPAGDFIAWDESGLLIPYYVQAGDFAAASVLAHEFGHARGPARPRTRSGWSARADDRQVAALWPRRRAPVTV